MISPLLTGEDKIAGVVSLGTLAPQRPPIFSRRELARVLNFCDGLSPDDQRVELAVLQPPGSAPILVCRPINAVGDGWLALAGHIEHPEVAAATPAPVKCSEPPKSSPAPQAKPVETPKPKAVESPRTADLDLAAPTSAPAPKPAPAKPLTEYSCEVCGKDITATQKQMSQLFLNKTLCKGCMDKATGKEATGC